MSLPVQLEPILVKGSEIRLTRQAEYALVDMLYPMERFISESGFHHNAQRHNESQWIYDTVWTVNKVDGPVVTAVFKRPISQYGTSKLDYETYTVTLSSGNYIPIPPKPLLESAGTLYLIVGSCTVGTGHYRQDEVRSFEITTTVYDTVDAVDDEETAKGIVENLNMRTHGGYSYQRIQVFKRLGAGGIYLGDS